MVAKGNKDGHNYDYGYVRGTKTQEMEKWGRETAAKRYGELRQESMKPQDQSQPQRLGDSNNLPDKGYPSDSRMDWKRGVGESAEGYAHFDHLRGKEPTGSRGRRR
jgi:hypothetical protein